MISELCQEVYVDISDERVVQDGIEYKDHFIVLDVRFGLWRPVIFERTGDNIYATTLRGVCSGLMLVPTKNEAFARGKEIVDEITRDK